MGLFAGSGVGKSTLLGMMARGTAADVVVLALVGERGREVRSFLEHDLGPEGLAKSVVVVSTSDGNTSLQPGTTSKSSKVSASAPAKISSFIHPR